MQNLYRITLTTGIERVVTREETDGKSIIGLWIWALKQKADVMLDFNECVVNAEHVMMIDRPEQIAYDDPTEPEEEEEIVANSDMPRWMVDPKGYLDNKGEE